MPRTIALLVPILVIVFSGILAARPGGDLENALAARIGNLTMPGTKAEAKELKSLLKAQEVYEGALAIYDALEHYEELKDKTAIKLLAKAAKLLESSLTADPGILGNVEDIPELMEGWFDEVVRIVEAYGPYLTPEQSDRVEDLLSSLDDIESQAELLWMTGSWGKAMKLYAKSLTVALKAWKLCVKYTGMDIPPA